MKLTILILSFAVFMINQTIDVFPYNKKSRNKENNPIQNISAPIPQKTTFSDKFSCTVENIRFDLKRVKKIGLELRFYFTITSTQGDNKIGLGNGLGGKIAEIHDSNEKIYYIGRMALGDKRTTPYLDRIDLPYNTPVKALFISANKGVADLENIQLFAMETENKGKVMIRNIPVPFGCKLFPETPNTVEIEDLLFLTIKEISYEMVDEQKKLRVHFVINNNGTKDQECHFQGTGLKIHNTDNTEHQSYYIQIGNAKKNHYNQRYTIIPDKPVDGYFEFLKANDINKIKLLEIKQFGSRNKFQLFDLLVKE